MVWAIEEVSTMFHIKSERINILPHSRYFFPSLLQSKAHSFSFAMADNKIHHVAKWDDCYLATEVKEIEQMDEEAKKVPLSYSNVVKS